MLVRIIRVYLYKAGFEQDFTNQQVLHKGMELLEDVDHTLIASIYVTISLWPAFMRIVASKVTEECVRLLLGKQNIPLYAFTNRCLSAPLSDERRTYGATRSFLYRSSGAIHTNLVPSYF